MARPDTGTVSCSGIMNTIWIIEVYCTVLFFISVLAAYSLVFVHTYCMYLFVAMVPFVLLFVDLLAQRLGGVIEHTTIDVHRPI